MAVYTEVTQDQLEPWLAAYGLNHVENLQPIQGGITNSNYQFEIKQQRYFLTLSEQHSLKEIQPYLRLQQFLAQHQIPCALPLADQQQRLTHLLNNKPAVIFEFMAGSHVDEPNIEQCAELAAVVARLHVVAEKFSEPLTNLRDQCWFDSTAHQVQTELTTEQLPLLFQAQQICQRIPALPTGVIHADLFRDNVLFVNDNVSALIDFYYAHRGPWLFDLAIIINDWCLQRGAIKPHHYHALLSGYQAIRPLTSEEQHWLPAMRVKAALRFWLSRLQDYYFPPAASVAHVKNPLEFEEILRQAMSDI